MKFLVAFVALVAVASANPLNKPTTNDAAELEAIIAAINSPSTDPATAALLEEQLAAIITEITPIAVGPALVDFPHPDGGVVTAVEPSPVAVLEPVVQPSPVVIGEIPAGQTPLVQIIVNVNKPDSVVAPSPVVTPEVVAEPIVPGAVNIVESGDIVSPIQVVEPVVPETIQVVEGVSVEPVQVVNPVIVDPVAVGTPIIPTPAVVLPEELN